MDGLDLRSKREDDDMPSKSDDEQAGDSPDITSPRDLNEHLHRQEARPDSSFNSDFVPSFYDGLTDIDVPAHLTAQPDDVGVASSYVVSTPAPGNNMPESSDTHEDQQGDLDEPQQIIAAQWDSSERADWSTGLFPFSQNTAEFGSIDGKFGNEAYPDNFPRIANQDPVPRDDSSVPADPEVVGTIMALPDEEKPVLHHDPEDHVPTFSISDSIPQAGSPVINGNAAEKIIEDSQSSDLEEEPNTSKAGVSHASDDMDNSMPADGEESEHFLDGEVRSTTENQELPLGSVGDRQRSCLTLNMPLEVIGACWFMKRDMETQLLAVTSSDEKVVIHLTKKDSRVNLTFEALTPTSKCYEEDDTGCTCHIEALLEPPRKPTILPSTSSSGTKGRASNATASNSAADADHSKTEGVIGHNDIPNNVTISSRLRARPAGGIKYEDSDEDDFENQILADRLAAANTFQREEEAMNSFESSEEESGEDISNSKAGAAGGDDDDDLDKEINFGDLADDGKTFTDKAGRQRARRGREFGRGDFEWTPSKRSKRNRQLRAGNAPVKVKTEPQVGGDLTGDGSQPASDGQNIDSADAGLGNAEPSGMRITRQHTGGKANANQKHKKVPKDILTKVLRLRGKDGPKWEKKGTCPHCGVFYGNLSQHIGLYCPKNPNRQRAYHCCYCKFRSLDRASLVEHKTTHVLARDHKCEICDSSFFTRQRLVRHMRYVHLLGTNPVRIYTCDRCGKRFRYHSHYERHLTIHSEEKVAQCDQCGKFFKNSHNVRNHQSRMHPGKPQPFAYYCDKCGQGAHSITAHRCIVPGEMHGSRRRRAPRNSQFASSKSAASAAAASVLAAAAAAAAAAAVAETEGNGRVPPEQLPMPPAMPMGSPAPSTGTEDTNRQTPRSSFDPQVLSPRVVDYRSSNSASYQQSSQTCSSTSPVTAAAQIDCPPPSGKSSVHNSDRYMSPVAQQQFDRHVPSSFDPHARAQHLVDQHLAANVRMAYHHSHHANQGPPYDRRVLPSFEHHLPAMAHQPPQQPPYSNLFAVDPLLQLRAANVMYRMDY